MGADSLAVGDEAPSFVLPDVRGSKVSLADVLQKGRAALVFYRGGWCPICNRQLAELSGRYDEFQRRGVEILAISNEQVEQGRKVLDKIGPLYPLLLDSTGEVIESYTLVVSKRDPLGWILRKRAYAHPAVVLIGQDGVIQWAYRGRNYRDRPTPDEILKAIDVAGPSAENAAARTQQNKPENNEAAIEQSGPETKPSKGLHIGLWVVQVLLALAFGMAGAMKSMTPIDELATKMPWVTSAPTLVRFIGISELLGAIGLILPAATRIQPKLTAYAGAGIAVIMALGTAFHISRGELTAIPITLVLGCLAGFVIWGRLNKAPINPRGRA